MPAISDAIILAGGFGTRLRPLTLRTPKPLLDLGNRPLLETLFYRLAEAGVRRVALSVFHQAAQLRRALPGLRRFGLRVAVLREGKPLGTGGAIRFAWPDASRPCWVLNGDILSDFLPGPLARFHAQGSAAATLWTIPVEDPSPFGVLEFGRDGAISRFVEKPRPGESASRHINAGLYLLEPSVLPLIPRGRAVSVEREVFPALLQAGLGARAFRSPKPVYWNDVGTPENFLRANLDVLNGRLFGAGAHARALWGRPDAKGSLAAAVLRRGKGALLSQSVAGPGCSLGAGSRVEASVLMGRCRVGEGAEIRGTVLSQGCRIGEHARLSPGTVLGPGAVIPAYSRL